MITFGLALPHFDGLFPSADVAGAARTRAALGYARRAEGCGFSSVWVSDHLWLELGDGTRRRSPDCWTLLSAIAATTETVRLGSLVSAAPLREPTLLAHQVATVTDLAPGRVDVGLGAGWYEPEFTGSGVRFAPAAERLRVVEQAADTIRSQLGAKAPTIWIGGKRRGALSVAGRIADGWNIAWDPTPESYIRCRQTLETVASDNGRDAAAMVRSIGLTTLVGNDEDDLRRRWAGLQQWVPGGHLDAIRFERWRQRGLVGTPAEIRRRIRQWQALGVSHIICAFGIPFGIWEDEQLDMFTATWLSG